VSHTNEGALSEVSCESSLSLRIGNSLGCCSPSFSCSGELFWESILTAGESQDLGSIVSIMPWWSLIEYADTGGYGLDFTITTLVNQRSQLSNSWFHFQRRLALNVMVGIVLNESVGETDQASRCSRPDMNAH
jgi:hypothetical protein